MADRTMVDYTRKIKPYFEGVAPVEPVTTAASAHAVGTLFYLDGNLVRTTTAIAVGDTIALNTNVVDAGDIATLLNEKEKAPTVLTGTLAANATTVTFQDASITTNSDIRVMVPTDKYPFAPTSISVTTGQAVLTFEAQESAVNIKLKVW